MARSGLPIFGGDVMLGDRFRYWRGASGRRYLFTEVAPAEIADYRGAVAVEVAEPADAAEAEGRIVNLVEVDESGAVRRHAVGFNAEPSAAYVHLLAATPGERQAILLDLAAAL